MTGCPHCARREKRALGRVGEAAIAARYPTDDAVAADPVGAMQVAMAAMRATLDHPKGEQR